MVYGVVPPMSKTGLDTRVTSGGGPPGETGGDSGDDRLLPWLLRQKVSVPDRLAGYLDRTELVDRIMPTRRRLTVLNAPGGFGKTTLLAECCRRLRADGTPIAWLSIDEQDEPGVLDTYIAYACRSAVVGAVEDPERPAVPSADKAPGGSGSRTELAMREVARIDVPFVLVFDEVERLASPASAGLLDFLVKHGPPNLHLAFGCRKLPVGVDVASLALEGRATIVSAEDLRFSRTEVAKFFDGKLTQAQLTALISESAGWPFALRISRNEVESGGQGDPHAAQEIVENWVESRLFAGLGAEDREFLLDIGLLEWMDAALLDEVLERTDSMLRLRTMSVLVGMLEPVRSEGMDVWRLHPLIREHCVRRRFLETPERFRSVHRRIADALERRGQTAAAMRHAVEAGEPALAGEILERAGGVRLFSREGRVEFQAADSRLTEEIIEARPRLGLARCLSLLLSGRVREAKERYGSLAGALDELETRAGERAHELLAERIVVRGMIALYGGERFGSELIQTQLADVARLSGSPHVDGVTRGIMEYSQCISGNMTANFDDALNHGARARRFVGQGTHLSMFIDLQEGQIAMAQGRVQDAASLYRRAERVAKSSYVVGPEPSAICAVLQQELSLECARAPDLELKHVPEILTTGGSPMQVYAAASGAVVDLKLRDEGVESALGVAEEMLDYVRGAGLPALVRYMAGLRISTLAMAGLVEEAVRAWLRDDLPRAPEECLDLEGQTWREMEALSCARLRLMIGREGFDEARNLANGLRAVTSERDLKRTLMRALALSMVLEHRAGNGAESSRHLEDYLRLYAQTPYAGPLVRERETCTPLVLRFLDTASDASGKETARALLEAMERVDEAPVPALTEREREVLERLECEGDKQIAAALGLSTHGVRFHLRKLFDKLGARTRGEAVRRAREMGLFPGDV